MNIVFVTRSYTKKGGISRCVAELAEKFSQGHHVHIFANRWDEVLVKDNISFYKIKVISWPFFLKVLSFVWFGSRKLKTGSFGLVIGPLGDVASADILVAHSCHRAWIEIKKKDPVERLKYWLNPLHHIVLFLEKSSLKKGKYKKIISISRLTKNDLIKYYQLPEEDITVIYNGVNTAEFTPGNKNKYRPGMRQELGFADTDILLLFAANEFKRKGLSTLLEAVALPMQNAPVKLLIVGGDNPGRYTGLIQKLKITEQTYFYGPRRDMNRFYAASDVFVLPTKLEPFGLVITEAMASGLPVITSRLAGAAELISDGETGLLLKDPENPGELQDKIFQLVRNAGYRDKLGANAAVAMQQYSWEMVKTEYEKVCGGLTG
ncbi:MAG: glycosyltransferase family 4 protein [bacterium]|nr:glycosyltransferase family 4 protein [bacterium]MDD5755702.1 glycosyltransferase family 4 protein [bacterium]